jgi:antitoxin HicB
VGKKRQPPAPQNTQSEALERQGKRVPAIFYRTEAGGEPVREWLKGLSSEDRKRIGEDIKTVEFGWPIGMPVCRPLGDGIYRSEDEPGTKPNCTSALLYRQKEPDGAFARIHQENAEDAARGPRVGEEQQEQASAGTEMKGIAMRARKNRKTINHSGSSFDSFLEQEGIREEVEAVAIKRVLAWQLEQAMHKQQKSKQAMAKQLHTSRSQLDRLLDPRNVSVTLDTITRAARALGKRLIIRVTDVKTRRA